MTRYDRRPHQTPRNGPQPRMNTARHGHRAAGKGSDRVAEPDPVRSGWLAHGPEPTEAELCSAMRLPFGEFLRTNEASCAPSYTPQSSSPSTDSRAPQTTRRNDLRKDWTLNDRFRCSYPQSDVHGRNHGLRLAQKTRVMCEELPGRPCADCDRIHNDRSIRILEKDSARFTRQPPQPGPSSSGD